MVTSAGWVQRAQGIQDDGNPGVDPHIVAGLGELDVDLTDTLWRRGS